MLDFQWLDVLVLKDSTAKIPDLAKLVYGYICVFAASDLCKLNSLEVIV